MVWLFHSAAALLTFLLIRMHFVLELSALAQLSLMLSLFIFL